MHSLTTPLHSNHNSNSLSATGSVPSPTMSLPLSLWASCSSVCSRVQQCRCVSALRSWSLPRTLKMLALSVGLMACSLVQGVAGEYIWRGFEGFRFGYYLTLCQFIMYTAFSAGGKLMTSEPLLFKKAPFHIFGLLSVIIVITYAASNASLVYIDYATKIIVKSCKLVSVMVVGIVFFSRRFKCYEYVASVLLVIGLLFLALGGQSTMDVSLSMTGFAFIFTSLLADSVSGNIQDVILRDFRDSPSTLVFFSYSLGTLILFAINVLSNELSEGFRFCQQNPSIYFFIVLFGALGYATSTIFAYMIQESGIILSITLTTFRKCLSIILSFVVFPKPFSFYHFLAIVFIFSGIIIHVYKRTSHRLEIGKIPPTPSVGDVTELPLVANGQVPTPGGSAKKPGKPPRAPKYPMKQHHHTVQTSISSNLSDLLGMGAQQPSYVIPRTSSRNSIDSYDTSFDESPLSNALPNGPHHHNNQYRSGAASSTTGVKHVRRISNQSLDYKDSHSSSSNSSSSSSDPPEHPSSDVEVGVSSQRAVGTLDLSPCFLENGHSSGVPHIQSYNFGDAEFYSPREEDDDIEKPVPV